MASRSSNNRKSSNKVVRFPRLPRSLNIGTLLFGTILIYIFITLIVFLTQKKVTIYEVVSGTISGNHRYSALALKEEQIENAGESGYITYYARDGAKANAGMLICAVNQIPPSKADEDPTGTIVTTLSEKDLQDIKQQMSTFTVRFNRTGYSDVYDFKSNVQSIILQSTINEDAGSYISGSYYAPVSGFVVYSTDGLENIKPEDVTAAMFDEGAYQKVNLRQQQTVSVGAPMYKLVTSDKWELMFPVTESLKANLEGVEKISFRFLKDNNKFTAPFELVNGKDGIYGKITLNSNLVRFASDRYLDIDLIMSRVKGLKIPISAITEKKFVKIPEEYVTANENTSNEVHIVRESFAKDGSAKTSNVTATVYSHNRETGDYLLNPDLFQIGDYVIMPGTARKYQITEDTMETLQGVYNVNKGYAIFRQVNIIDENEQFCIVDDSNIFGLAAHDRIALNASEIKDDEIIR